MENAWKRRPRARRSNRVCISRGGGGSSATGDLVKRSVRGSDELAHTEAGVHPLRVVSGQVADEDVAAGVEVHRQRLCAASLDVLDLVNELDALAGFVDIAALFRRELIRRELCLEHHQLAR